MTILIPQISVTVSEQPEQALRRQLEKEYGLAASDVLGFRIRKKSLDARRKSRICFHYQLELDARDEAKLLARYASLKSCDPRPSAQPLAEIEGLDIRRHHGPRPVIIGSGPAGSFAALVLAEAGMQPIVIERGEAVEQRLRTVNKLRSRSLLTEESNYCFGEGGAGTFSDGKLTCGRNHPLVRYLFEQWVRFGAPEEILYEAHPHIGTDYLIQLVKKMRTYIESLGGTFLFGKRFEGFSGQSSKMARYALRFCDGEVLETDQLIMAIGHSARDTYQSLLASGVALGPKPFAIGARFEHPQEIIDEIQFGTCSLLPAAEYKLAAQAAGRGIWTFCMCPGGHLLPTSAQSGHLAINGMSYHARNSGFANAAIVVNINREDYFQGHPLDGVRFQQKLEQQAFAMGGGDYFSPAQRMLDFLKGRDSKGEMRSTYKPGVRAGRLDRLLPDYVVKALREALAAYNQKMRGFISEQAIIAGVESKTSAPVVIDRDRQLQSSTHPGLFPCGEGAGYAGGIVSAGLDGVRVAQACLRDMVSRSSRYQRAPLH